MERCERTTLGTAYESVFLYLLLSNKICILLASEDIFGK